MGQAAQLGALVLEVERGRGQSGGRGPASAAVRPRRDGAAPLIGSTPAMAALRDRIERVANTDFTGSLKERHAQNWQIRFDVDLPANAQIGRWRERGSRRKHHEE